MTTHNEHKKEKLARSQKLSAEARQSNSTKQYFSCICHAVHSGISQFELAYHIAGIGRRDTETDNKDHRTRYILASVQL